MKLTDNEFSLMKGYIEKHCGIHLDPGKEYLVETRLTDLVMEQGCRNFYEFYQKAQAEPYGKLRDRIVDAMTTNETYFFRDDNLWNWMREEGIPELLQRAASSSGPVRIWSAAASTGQEGYSLAMLIDEMAREKGNPALADRIEIVGTDISSAALFLAIAGRYDQLAIKRGLSDARRTKYFRQDGNVWVIDEALRKRVKFQRFNLMNSFAGMGAFDLILCRYVAIYFAEEFKRDLFHRLALALKPGSPLLLGATETLRGLSNDFEIEMRRNTTVFARKPEVRP